MKKNSKWKALLYVGITVLAVVLLFMLKRTVLDTYSTEEYNSLKAMESGEVFLLFLAVATLFCFLFCGTIRTEILGPGRAIASYAGLMFSAYSIFLPETLFQLKLDAVGVYYPYYLYGTIKGAIMIADTLCVFGILVLLVMIGGSTNNEYKEKVQKAITGLACVLFVLSLASLGFKTFSFNGWAFFYAMFFTAFGCVVLFLCWTKKILRFNIIDKFFERIIANCAEDEYDDDDEE